MIDIYWEKRKRIQFERSTPDKIETKRVWLYGQWVDVTVYAPGEKKEGLSMSPDYKTSSHIRNQLSPGGFRSSGHGTH